MEQRDLAITSLQLRRALVRRELHTEHMRSGTEVR